MGKWVAKINIKPYIEQYEDNYLTVQGLGKRIARTLREFMKDHNIGQPELEEIETRFEYCCETEEEANDLLSELDWWGDQHAVIIKKQF